MRFIGLVLVVVSLLITAAASKSISFAQGAGTPTPGSTTPVVTNLNDTDDGACDTQCTLREAITLSAPDATITFAPGLTGTNTLGSGFTLNQNVTITGPGANVITISGNNAVRIFYI